MSFPCVVIWHVLSDTWPRTHGLGLTVSDSWSRTSGFGLLAFWTSDEGPKIDEEGPNGGLGHSWGMSPGSARQFIGQGHPTGRVPSVTRTGDSGGVVMGRNPLLTLHVNCPQRHFMVAEPLLRYLFGAAAASGFFSQYGNWEPALLNRLRKSG